MILRGGPSGSQEARLEYGVNVLDGLRRMADGSVHCAVTSPPYWGLRDYGHDATEWPRMEFTPMADVPPVTLAPEVVSLGLENSPLSFIGHLVAVFREVYRVLKDDGVLFINMGDSYVSTTGYLQPIRGKGRDYDRIGADGDNSMDRIRPYKIRSALRHKNTAGIPWRLALALQADGWVLRNDIVWDKGSGMPEPVADRFSRSHEYLFMLVKQRVYKFNKVDARSVWRCNSANYKGAHHASFPEPLIVTAVAAGSNPGDTILDPFSGTATTGRVAFDLGRNYVGIDLSTEYLPLAQEKLTGEAPAVEPVADDGDVFDLFGEEGSE